MATPMKESGYQAASKTYLRDDSFEERREKLPNPANERSKKPTKGPENREDPDDGEEEECSGDETEEGEDTPPDEETIAAALIVEGMEGEAKQLYLGKEGVDGAEHEWVDRMPMAMSMKASAMSAKERERAKFAVLVSGCLFLFLSTLFSLALHNVIMIRP